MGCKHDYNSKSHIIKWGKNMVSAVVPSGSIFIKQLWIISTDIVFDQEREDYFLTAGSDSYVNYETSSKHSQKDVDPFLLINI